MILVDTNVWSELTKPTREPRVVEWLRAHDGQTILSTLVIGEIQQGIAMTSGPEKRLLLINWKDELLASHADKILSFDFESAIAWGNLAAPLRLNRESRLTIDVMLAAQALVHGLPFATRNRRDFSVKGLEIIDPWTA